MVKQLLSLAAVAAMALNASAYELPLTSDSDEANAPLFAGWSTSYDQATKTITFEGEWTGRGWGFWGEPFDGTDFTDVEIKFEPTVLAGQVVVQYSQLVYDENGDVVQEWGSDKHEQTVEPFAVGAEIVTVALNKEFKDKIDQIYIQCGSIAGVDTPTITLVSAEIVDNSDVPVNYVVFEGEQEIDWWSNAVTIPTKFFEYLVVGAKIEITFSAVNPEAENPCFKVQTLNSDWTQTWLPSIALVDGAFVKEDGSDASISVTEPCTVDIEINEEDAEAIHAAGVQNIMIVGDGLTVSKVEIIPASSGIQAVEAAEANAPVVYYNLQGMKVLNPSNGIFIKRQGNKAVKVVM